ncbi:hypothetical protein ScPMuIL_011646 [Solemya velum]
MGACLSQEADYVSDEPPKQSACDSCSLKKPVLAPPGRPTIALVSFPRSGNTWTRHLLQQLSGVATGSVYCDRQLKKTLYPAECRTDRVLVVKTHNVFNQEMMKFDAAVILIRNPFLSIFSFFEYISTKRSLTKHASLVDFQEHFKEFAKERIHQWENTYFVWLKKFKGPTHLVIYDHMLEHLQQDLAGMAEFLHFNYTTKDMCCTIKQREGRFHRDRSRINPKTVYSADIIKLFENTIDRVLSILHNRFPMKANFRFQSIREMD